ncbi:MAG: glycosyltransferase family 9 protein [Pseudodesulfovibrio sp.]|nr:glycosyltransferase family 9 protein [Pseudodesulfovibrio sp.]
MQIGTPKKILIIRIDRIGDMFSATPTIRALREAYPDARIDLMASDGNAIVARNNPHIDNLYVFPLKKFWVWPMHFIRLRLTGYDWVVELNGISGTALRLANATGAKIKASPAHLKRRDAYNVTITPSDTEHMVKQQLQLAARLGAPSTNTTMVFPVDQALIDRARATYPIKAGTRRIGVFIGNAKKTETRWPEDKFVALTDELLKDKQNEIYIIAGPGDEPLLDGFTFSDRRILYPGGTLEALGAFLKTCDLFVTSSTGPMHLAAACDIPMVAILARYTFNCWRPLGDIHHIINSGHPGVDVTAIKMDEVLQAVKERLGD